MQRDAKEKKSRHERKQKEKAERKGDRWEQKDKEE